MKMGMFDNVVYIQLMPFGQNDDSPVEWPVAPVWHLSVCFCRRQKWGNPDLNEHMEHHLFYQNPVTTVDIFIRLREIQKSYSQSSDSFIWIWLNIGCPVYASGFSSFSMCSSCKWGFSTVLDTWIHFRWFNHHCQLVEPLHPNVDIGEVPSFDA